jgi:enoyl-CoA hydratase
MALQTFGDHVRIETVEAIDAVATIVLELPACRNAVDRPTADALSTAFRRFEANAACMRRANRRKTTLKNLHPTR